MTQEEKAKAYDRVSKEVKDFFEGRQKMYSDVNKTLEYLFPELAESEDERTRKELMDFVVANTICKDGRREKYLAWLEKQKEFTSDEEKQGKEYVLWCINQAKKHAKDENEMGTCWFAEQWLEKQGDAKREIEKQSKPIEIKRGKTYLCTKTHKYAGEEWREGTIYDALEDYALLNQECIYYCPAWSKEEHNNFFKEVGYAEISPKFKVDNWITDGENTWKIAGIRKLDYLLRSQNGDAVNIIISYVDEHFHLWSIQDAKDGDVLVCEDDKMPFIFKGLLDHHYPNCPVAYCSIDNEKEFIVCHGDSWWDDCKIEPATKEQREFLFAKMKEAGYEWDTDKKELKKNE